MKVRFIILLICQITACNSTKEKDPVIEKEIKYFDAISANDIPMEKPNKGEWLYEHKEPGQTFEQYKNTVLIKPTDTCNIIYLKPIGKFTTIQLQALEQTRKYLEFFYQLKTVLLDYQEDNTIPDSYRRKRDDGHEQLLAPYILDNMLNKKIPPNGIVLMAITEKDLYPEKDWNFVFGLANYNDCVAVCSIYRLQGKTLDSVTYNKCLMRLINVTSHEIGHMFSLQHCINAMCVMNGSNSLSESDKEPNRICSECQKKLYWNIRYDNRKRINELSEFFKLNNLEKDFVITQKDIDKLK